MGLLNYIDTMQQKGPGLLARAEKYGSSILQSADFYAWCKKNHFAHAAIFQRDDDIFCITKSVGFDAESIALSFSSKDFWDGTLATKSSWQSFTQGTPDIAAFNQFFSEEMLSMIVKLHVIKLEDSMLMVVQEDEEFSLAEDTDTITQDLIKILYVAPEAQADFEREAAIKKGLTISHAHLYLLSLKGTVTTAIKDVPFPDEQAKQRMTTVIYEELYRHCARLFQRPNCCVLGADGEIKIAFFAKDEIDEQLLQFHIMHALQDMTGSEAAKSIILLTAGICPNVKGTLAFLQQS